MSKFAWVTLATNDSYSLGALVVANSLKKVNTTHQTAVLITPGVSESMKSKLQATFNLVVEVNVLDSKDAANLALLSRPELGITFTKLHCWRLTQFEKCVFLDADTFVLQNCDELFDREELSAAPDVGWPDCFNSGVFVFKPSLDTFGKLVEFATKQGSFDGGDQGLLNSFFSDWAHKDITKHLPFIYNTCSTACYSYLPAFKQFGENVKILHFIGQVKPWLLNFDSSSKTAYAPPGYTHLSGFLQQWWNIFCADVHPSLTSEMGGLAGALAQLTLGAPRSAEQQAYEESMRRQCWEAGNIDYLVKVGSSFNEAIERTSEHIHQQTITQITKEGRIIEKKIVTYPGEETTEIEEIEEVDGQTVSVKRSVEGGEKKAVKAADKLTELKNQPVVLIPGYQTVEFDEKTNSTIVTEKTTTGYQQTITTIMANGKKKIQTKTFFDPIEIEGEEEEEETYEETETFEPGTKKTTVTTGRKDVVAISEKSVESKVTEAKSEVTEQSAITKKDDTTTIVKKDDTKVEKQNKKESKVLTDLKNQPVVIVPGFQTVEFDEKTNTKTVTEKTTTGYQQTITTVTAEGRTRVQTKIFYDPVEVSCEVEEEETCKETVVHEPSTTKTTTERKDVLESKTSDKTTEITEVESKVNQTTNVKQDQTTTVMKEDTEKAIVEVEKINKKKSKVLEDLKKQPVVIVPGFQKVEFDETTNTTTVTEKTTTGYQQTITTVTAEGLTKVQTKVFYDPVEVSCEEEEEETIEETVTYESGKPKTTTTIVDTKDIKATDQTTEITEVESQINQTTTNTNTKQDQTTTVLKEDTEKAIVEVEEINKKKSKVLEDLKKQPVVIVPGFQKVDFDEKTNTTTVTEKTTTGSQQTITTVTSDGRTIVQTKVFYDPVEVSCEVEEETIEETVTYEPGTTKTVTERKDTVDTKASDKTTEITEVESQINQTTKTKQDQTTTVTKEDTEKALVEVDKKDTKTKTDLKNEPVVIVPGFQKVEFDEKTNTTTVTEKTTTGYQQTITTVTTDGRTIVQTQVFYDPVEEEETYEVTEIVPATTKTTTTTTVAQTKNVAQSVTSATNVTEVQTTEQVKQIQEQTSKSIKQHEQVTTEAVLQTDNKNTTTDVKDLQLVSTEPSTTVQKKTTSDGKEIEVTTTVSADGKTKTLRKTVRRPSEEIEIEEYEETQTYEPGEVKIITTAKTMPTTEQTDLVETTDKNTVARVKEQQKVSTIAQSKAQQNISQIEISAKTATSTSSSTMTTTHEQTQVKSQINVSAKVATSETSSHATQVKALTKQTTIEAKETTAEAKQMAKVSTSQITTQATQVKALTKQTTIEAKQTTAETRQVKTEAKQTIAEAKQVKTDAKQVKTEAKQVKTDSKQTTTKTDAKQIKTEGNVSTSKMVTSSKTDEKDAKSKTQVKSVTASKKDDTEIKSKALTGTTKKDLALKSDSKTTVLTKDGAVIGKPKVTKKDGETTTEVVRRVPGGTEYTWTTVRADGTTKMESKTYFDEVEVECSEEEEEIEEYEEVTEETVPGKTTTKKKPGPIAGPKTPTVTDATPPSTPPLKPLVIGGSSSALKAEHEILDTPPLDKAEQLRKKKLPSTPVSKAAPKAEKSAVETPKPPPRKKEVKKPAAEK